MSGLDTAIRERPRRRCVYCSAVHRSDTPACRKCRPLLAEDWRYAGALDPRYTEVRK